MFENFATLLYLSILIIAITAIYFISYKISKRNINNFANNSLWENLININFTKEVIKNICFILALFFIAVAIARPKWGLKQVQAKSLSSDIVIAIDVSKSMLAQDLKPDRLTRAKMVFKDLTEQQKGQRVGLIAFAGEAYWQCPLTSDIKVFEMFLSLLDTDTVPFTGTNLAEPIKLACTSLEKIPTNTKAVVIITDGESFDGDLKESIKIATESKTTIFCVGIGTQKGEPIPTYDEKGGFKEYLKDEKGKTVITKLDDNTLEYIATATGGKYYNLNQNPTVAGLATRLNKLDKREGTGNIFNNLEDRFYYPLSVAVILLIIFLFLPVAKNKNN
jgi:Ca-activated chloride channel family protein